MRQGLFARENGPVCIILLMVLLVSAATLTGGIVRFMEEGLTDNSLILILFGAIVFVFVVLGFVITLCTEAVPQRQPSTPADPDDPPKYRETWRREHLESLSQSQATDTYTGDPALETRGSTGTNFSRLDVRSLWKPVVIPGVHESPRRDTTVSMTGMSQAEADISSGRPRRANTHPCVYISDEGLPTYEEAVRR